MNAEVTSWKDHAKTLEAELKKLRTELTTAREEARADKARLDSGRIIVEEDHNGIAVRVFYKVSDLRAAIDQANGQ